MKIMSICLLALALILPGCATNSDLKKTNSRLDRVEANADCHGLIVELNIYGQQMRQLMSAEEKDIRSMAELHQKMQLTAQAAQFACDLYDKLAH